MRTDASDEFSMRSTNSTKQSRNTDIGVGRRTTSAGNCTKHGNVAGASVSDGGMNTSTAGAQNAIGTTATTTKAGAYGIGVATRTFSMLGTLIALPLIKRFTKTGFLIS